MADNHREGERRSIRLRGYDYGQAGAYFITICAERRDRLPFGEVVNEQVRLSQAGMIVNDCWLALPGHFQHVELDEFVVMPNHVHGIVIISGAGRRAPLRLNGGNSEVQSSQEPNRAQHAAPLQPPVAHQTGVAPGSLAAIVRSFKAASTKRMNEQRNSPGASLWQRSYYEHMVRSEDDLNDIRRYVQDNPAKWALDEENPAARSPVRRPLP